MPEVENDNVSIANSDSVPQSHQSAFMAFLKQVASFTGDLSQITAPSFLLNGISLLEYSAHWCDYPQLLVDINSGSTPQERMLLVTKWFLSTLYGSYHERCADGSERKPYNPILGEEFHTSISTSSNTTSNTTTSNGVDASVVVEQVSHHPPVSAFYVTSSSNTSNTTTTTTTTTSDTSDTDVVTVSGHCGQKSKFKSMNIRVAQTGRAVVECRKFSELYIVRLPELIIRGLFSGKVFLELDGNVKIVGSNGYISSIDFLPKPWFSGEYHHLKGAIYHESDIDKVYYRLSGRWVDVVEYYTPLTPSTTTATGGGGGGSINNSGSVESTTTTTSSTGGGVVELWRVDLGGRPQKVVKPVEEQMETESRKVWKKVTDALVAGDYGVASKEKSIIEQRQREKRKARKEQGIQWEPKYFVFKDDSHEGRSVLREMAGKLATGDDSKDRHIDHGTWTFIEG